MCFVFVDWIGRWGKKGGVEKKEVEREKERLWEWRSRVASTCIVFHYGYTGTILWQNDKRHLRVCPFISSFKRCNIRKAFL